MEVLIKISADRIKAISSGNAILVNEYASISHFIKTNSPEIYHDILARTSMVEGDCLFYPNKFRNYRPIEDFTVNSKKSILESYFQVIQYFKTKAEDLIDSGSLEKQKWGEILNSIFNPNNNYVFSDGNHIILVWGFEFNNVSDYADIIGKEVQAVVASIDDTNDDAVGTGLTALDQAVDNNITLDETKHTEYTNSTNQKANRTGKKIWVKSQKTNRLNWLNVIVSGM